MNPQLPNKSKRSTMACIHCRERKVKCDNNNDGLSCEKCKKTNKDCRYEPVTPVSDSQLAAASQADPPITGDKPIMTVYQDPPPSTAPPPQVAQWSEPYIGPQQGPPVHLPYDSMNTPSVAYQPPQAYPQTQYPMTPFYMPNQQQFSYPYQGQSPYPTTGHGYWTGPRGSNASNNKSGDRPDDSGEPSGSS